MSGLLPSKFPADLNGPEHGEEPQQQEQPGKMAEMNGGGDGTICSDKTPNEWLV
jgi:hypothetical protein